MWKILPHLTEIIPSLKIKSRAQRITLNPNIIKVKNFIS
jgi:hypothetical protein